MKKDKIYELHSKTPLEVKLQRSKTKIDKFMYDFGVDGVFCLVNTDIQSLVLHDLLVEWGYGDIEFVFMNINNKPLKDYIKNIIPNITILHDITLGDYKKRYDKKPILSTIDDFEVWKNNSCINYKDVPTARPFLTLTYDEILEIGGVKFENDIKRILKTTKKVLQNSKRCDII